MKPRKSWVQRRIDADPELAARCAAIEASVRKDDEDFRAMRESRNVDLDIVINCRADDDL